MAHKRKANEAFGKSKQTQAGQLSAFAAAKIAKQARTQSDAYSPAVVNDLGRSSMNSDTVSIPSCTRESSPNFVEGGQSTGVQIQPTLAKQLSTWQPSTRNILLDDDHLYEISLLKGETATFFGEYDVEVGKGAVTIYGAFLQSSSPRYRVYAPGVQALPPITARSDAVVRLLSVKSIFVNLERFNPIWRNIWPTGCRRSFQYLQYPSDDRLQRSLDCIELSRETESFISSVLHNMEPNVTQITVTVGGKSTGKSTISRFLCNAALRRHKSCFYLDVDPGQPEFGPAGQLSLVRINSPILGPSFTHFATAQSRSYELMKCHTIAAITFRNDPEHYVACVIDLFRQWQRQDPKQPLIVNTCGWVNGSGADALLKVVAQLQPSNLVLLEPLDQAFIQSIESQIRGVFRPHTVPRRGPPRPLPRTPAEYRTMQTMAYFHTKKSGLLNVTTPVSAKRPWIVSYDEADGRIQAIISYGQMPHPTFLAEVLEGSIVAIAITSTDITARAPDDSNDTSQPNAAVRRTPEGLPYSPQTIPLDPRQSQTIGLALVRAIDPTTKTLHLTTPLATSQIEALNSQNVVLVRGAFDPPDWAYLEDLYAMGLEGDDDARLQRRPWLGSKRGGMVGVEGAVWRLRHPPVPASLGR